MGFHNNRFIIIEKKESGIFISRKIKSELHIDFIKNNTNVFNKYIILPCFSEEFDIDIDLENGLSILYINNNKELVLHKQRSNKVESSKVIETNKKRIYYLSFLTFHNTDNIFYLESTEDNKKLKLYHKLIDEDIKEYLVDDIDIYEIVNTFKVLRDGNNLLILYYYKNQICLKGFDIVNKQWSHSITLTDNRNKLYLDAIKIGKKLHLVYADYDGENFVTKCVSYIFENDRILKVNEAELSPKGNYTDPVILKMGNKIWICYKDTNQLLSIYSMDNGTTWSEIYQWKETKKLDMVKYRYITDIKEDRAHIDYVYGCTGKDIKFIGFGDFQNAEILNK